ncbi:MAG: hypothetical protein ACK41D_07530 [Rubricoccaceae bacterium]
MLGALVGALLALLLCGAAPAAAQHAPAPPAPSASAGGQSSAPPSWAVWLLPQVSAPTPAAGETGAEFRLRAARLRVRGAESGLRYFVQVDVAAAPRLWDAVLTVPLPGRPAGASLALDAGVMRAPVGASHLTPIPLVPLGERPAFVRALVPGREPGGTGRLPGLAVRSVWPAAAVAAGAYTARREAGQDGTQAYAPVLAARGEARAGPLRGGASAAARYVPDAGGERAWGHVVGVDVHLDAGAAWLGAEAMAGRRLTGPLPPEAAATRYAGATLEGGFARGALEMRAGLEALREEEGRAGEAHGSAWHLEPVGALRYALGPSAALLARVAPHDDAPLTLRLILAP